MRGRASPVDAPDNAAACDRVGRLGDPERGRGVEQPGHQVAVHVRQRVAGSEAASHTGFDTDFDRANELYAANTIGFAYMDRPIQVSESGPRHRIAVL
jgi:hypothetical protein